MKATLLLLLVVVGVHAFNTDYRASVLRSQPTFYFRFEESSSATEVTSTSLPRLTAFPSTGSGLLSIGNITSAVAASRGILVSPKEGLDLTVDSLPTTDLTIAIDTPEIQALLPQSNSSWTWEQWFRWDGTVTAGNRQTLFRYRGQTVDGAVPGGWRSGITAYLTGYGLDCWVGDGPGWQKTVSLPHTKEFWSNVWRHTACVYDQETQTLSAFVDGQLEGSVHSPRGWLSLEDLRAEFGTNGIRGAPAEALHITGNNDFLNNSYHFYGGFDEFALYQRVVTPEELQQHYREGNPECFATGTFQDPAHSCDALASQDFPSGFYYVANKTGDGTVFVWCAMDFASGGWARVGTNFSLAAIYTRTSVPDSWKFVPGGISLNRDKNAPFYYEFITADDFALLDQLRIDDMAVDSDLQLFSGEDGSTNVDADIRIRYMNDLATELAVKHSVTVQDDQDISIMAGGDRLLCEDKLPPPQGDGCGTAGSANTPPDGVPSDRLILASARFLPNCPTCFFYAQVGDDDATRNEFWVVGSRYYVGVKTKSQCPSRLVQWHAFDEPQKQNKAKAGQDAKVHYSEPQAPWDLGPDTTQREVRFTEAAWQNNWCPPDNPSPCVNRDDPTNSADLVSALQDGSETTTAAYRNNHKALTQTLQVRLQETSSVGAVRVQVWAGTIGSMESSSTETVYGGFGGVRISTAGVDGVFTERLVDENLFGRCLNNYHYFCSPARIAAAGIGLGSAELDIDAFEAFAGKYWQYSDRTSFATASGATDNVLDAHESWPARGWKTFQLPETVDDVAFVRLQFGTISVLVPQGANICTNSNSVGGCGDNSVIISELRIVRGSQGNPQQRWTQRARPGDGTVLAGRPLTGTAHGLDSNCPLQVSVSDCFRQCQAVAGCNAVNYSNATSCCMKSFADPFTAVAHPYNSELTWQSWVLLPAQQGGDEPDLGKALYMANGQDEDSVAGSFCPPGFTVYNTMTGQPGQYLWFWEPKVAWLETAPLPIDKSFTLSFFVRVDAHNYHHGESILRVYQPPYFSSADYLEEQSAGMSIGKADANANFWFTLPNWNPGETVNEFRERALLLNETMIDGQWHHFVVRATMATSSTTHHSVDVFVDGEPIISNLTSRTTRNFEGICSWNHHFHGAGCGSARQSMALDEVRVYDTALTECQIQALGDNIRDPHQNSGGVSGLPICAPTAPLVVKVTAGRVCSEASVEFDGAVSFVSDAVGPWFVVSAESTTGSLNSGQDAVRVVVSESPAKMTGLLCNSDYNFFLTAQDNAGSSNTIKTSFTTAMPPSTSPSAMHRWCQHRRTFQF